MKISLSISRRSVLDEVESAAVCDFYFEQFGAINARTPIVQTWPRDEFRELLIASDVSKYILQKGYKLVGLGLVTRNLTLDSWLSSAFFEHHFPGRPVYNFMVVTVTRDAGRHAATILLRAMLTEAVENDAILVNFHLQDRDVTRIAQKASNGRVKLLSKTVEVCALHTWTEGGSLFNNADCS